MYYSGSQADMSSGLAEHNGYQQIVSSSTPPRSSEDATPDSRSHTEHASYGAGVAYCFTVNYILGVGVLGMPYAFYKGGWALSTICLGVVTVMATFTALWLVDVSLRAQYLKRQGHLLSGSSDSARSHVEINHPTSSSSHHRYEMNELVEIFLGVNARRFYELFVIIYLLGALWSYASVFSSSLASHIGLPGINGGDECNVMTDGSHSCKDLYLTYMGMFAAVAIPLTCLDLTEMKVMQIALAIFRFVSLATMMATSLVAVFLYPNPNPEAGSPAHAPYISDLSAFDWSNLGLVFPIAIYSQIFHHSTPGLTHPLREKRSAPRVFTGVLLTTMMLYTALGITVALYYGDSITSTCTLAWASYTGGHDAAGESKPKWASFISYLVVLFPPIDIISAFPLNAITLGNNLLCAFVEDESKQRLKRYKLPFRLIAAAPPIVGAMIVKDLSVILKYTGCVGVIIAFIYPVFLQWQSKRTCARLAILVEKEDGEDGLQATGGLGGGSVDSDSDLTVPTYNGSIVNHPLAMWTVLAFASVGLVAVIVLSILGQSN